MGEIVASAVAQEVASRVFSYFSTKIHDKVSRARLASPLEKLEMALSRLAFYLEFTGKKPITSVPLLHLWNMNHLRYKEGVLLLDKHKLQVASGSKLSIFSPRGLSSSDAEEFERYANQAKEFAADVELGCPLRRDIDFRRPFVRKLLEGKTLWYQRIQGRQRFTLEISPWFSEGRGVEAWLWCECFDRERLGKGFRLDLMLRLSESKDIVETAVDCLRSSASLQNLVAPDAIVGEITRLSNLEDISDLYYGSESLQNRTRVIRPDPLCCQSNGHIKSTMSSELSQIFPEQISKFRLSCHIPALEYSLPGASDEASRNVMADLPPLKVSVSFEPHHDCWFGNSTSWVSEVVGGKREHRPFGDIQQTSDMVRSKSVHCLIHQPETTNYRVSWFSRHGYACFEVEKPSVDMVAASKARGRYNTRSSAKRIKRA